MIRRPRMPKTVRLPFGYSVTIKYRTTRQLEQAGLGVCHGAWVTGEKCIYVNRDDHIAEQMETVAHELQHAAGDYRHWVDQYWRLPLQQESAMTAMDLAEDDE
jgi:hypothetical protein